MNEAIHRLYEQNESIHNLYVSISNKEIFNSRKVSASNLINIRSMTKSIVSLLVGVAIKEGYIKSLETPVSHYLFNAPVDIVISELLSMLLDSILMTRIYMDLLQVVKIGLMTFWDFPYRGTGILDIKVLITTFYPQLSVSRQV